MDLGNREFLQALAAEARKREKVLEDDLPVVVDNPTEANLSRKWMAAFGYLAFAAEILDALCAKEDAETDGVRA